MAGRAHGLSVVREIPVCTQHVFLSAAPAWSHLLLSCCSQLCCEPGWDTCSWPCPLGSLGPSEHLCQGLSKEFILEDVLKYHELQSQWEQQSWKAPQSVFAVPKAFCLTVRGQIHWLFPSELLTRRGAVPWIRKSCAASQESCQEGEGVFWFHTLLSASINKPLFLFDLKFWLILNWLVSLRRGWQATENTQIRTDGLLKAFKA